MVDKVKNLIRINSLYQISWRSVKPLYRHIAIFDFQDGGHSLSWILKSAKC